MKPQNEHLWWKANFALRPQAITWANIDQWICHHMVSLGHSELKGTHIICIAWCLCKKNQNWITHLAFQTPHDPPQQGELWLEQFDTVPTESFKTTFMEKESTVVLGKNKALFEAYYIIMEWSTNFDEIWMKIGTFSFKKMHVKMLCAKWQPFCLGLIVLTPVLYSITFE